MEDKKQKAGQIRKKEILDERDFYERNKYKKARAKSYDTVCMLSGGLDSYIGAIDFFEERIR